MTLDVEVPEVEPATLLTQAATGDASALAQFYDDHVDGLYAFVYYRVGRVDAISEDVVQETFLRALDRASEFDAERGSIHAWLCTTSRNVIRAHNTQDRRHRDLTHTWERIDADLAEVFQALEHQPLGDEVLARAETRDLVNMTIANLPLHYRRALEHKYVHGESVREIADALALSEDATKSMLARARRAFREAFATLASAFGEEAADV